jgi:hypothetical protein
MSVRLLAPIDQRSEIWKFYKVQRIVIDTPDEGGARQQVAKRPAPRGSALNPWLEPALTSCEKVDESLGRQPGAQRRIKRLSRTRGGRRVPSTRGRNEKGRPEARLRPVELGRRERAGSVAAAAGLDGRLPRDLAR